METLLLLIPLLACPLAMATIGAIGWLWAKASGRAEKANESTTDSARGVPATEGA
jgi:nitrogen fixation-related uncharacterized protein